MAKTFTKDGIERVAEDPREIVRLRANGWHEVTETTASGSVGPSVVTRAKASTIIPDADSPSDDHSDLSTGGPED